MLKKFAQVAALIVIGLSTANCARQSYAQAGPGYQQSGYREVAVAPQDVPPYAGAIRSGSCEDPGATFINAEVGCVRRVSDGATMERYRGKIRDICGDRHGPVQMQVAPNALATYNCP